MSFADSLRKARLAAGLTQLQVAQRMEITKSTYCGYETGKRQPDVPKIKMLSQILGVPADVLLETNTSAKSFPRDPELEELIELYRAVDAEGRKQMLTQARQIKRSGEYVALAVARLDNAALKQAMIEDRVEFLDDGTMLIHPVTWTRPSAPHDS